MNEDIAPVPIETHRRHQGYDLKQVKRMGDVAIYEQSKKLNGKIKVIAYEVVCIRVRGPERFQGRVFPKREVYPSDEQWGMYGFTCAGMDRALEKAQELLTTRYSGDSDPPVDTK